MMNKKVEGSEVKKEEEGEKKKVGDKFKFCITN